MKEIWKNIDKDYKISNLGRVKSITRMVNHWRGNGYKKKVIGRILKPIKYNNGYYYVSLHKKNNIFAIHRLVSQAFIENFKIKPCVNHLDGNKANNKLKNLQWCTYSENEKHSYNNLGKIPWNKGKTNIYSEETLKKMSKTWFKRNTD